MFNTLIYTPLYNGLIALMNLLPWADVGFVIIVFTILVKLVLFPLGHKAAQAQAGIREIDPELKKIRETHKDDKQKQAQETMALYKKHGINPFSSIGLILIQLPIIFGLYYIFLKSGLPEIDMELLYSFVSAPENVRMTLFGFGDITQKSIILAVFVGITQFIQTRISMPKTTAPKQRGVSLKEDLAHSMQLQMRYVLPVIVAIIAYTLSATIGLYWTTSNIFTIGQELIVRRNKNKEHDKGLS